MKKVIFSLTLASVLALGGLQLAMANGSATWCDDEYREARINCANWPKDSWQYDDCMRLAKKAYFDCIRYPYV